MINKFALILGLYPDHPVNPRKLAKNKPDR
jgi:hypothetical protein